MVASRTPRQGDQLDHERIADIRIRAANLGWMLDHGRLDEAEQAIAGIRQTLGRLDVAIYDRRRKRAA